MLTNVDDYFEFMYLDADVDYLSVRWIADDLVVDGDGYLLGKSTDQIIHDIKLLVQFFVSTGDFVPIVVNGRYDNPISPDYFGKQLVVSLDYFCEQVELEIRLNGFFSESTDIFALANVWALYKITDRKKPAIPIPEEIDKLFWWYGKKEAAVDKSE